MHCNIARKHTPETLHPNNDERLVLHPCRAGVARAVACKPGRRLDGNCASRPVPLHIKRAGEACAHAVTQGPSHTLAHATRRFRTDDAKCWWLSRLCSVGGPFFTQPHSCVRAAACREGWDCSRENGASMDCAIQRRESRPRVSGCLYWRACSARRVRPRSGVRRATSRRRRRRDLPASRPNFNRVLPTRTPRAPRLRTRRQQPPKQTANAHDVKQKKLNFFGPT